MNQIVNKYLIVLVDHLLETKNSKIYANRPQSDKDLKDKAFKIASNPKYDGYQRGLASMV